MRRWRNGGEEEEEAAEVNLWQLLFFNTTHTDTHTLPRLLGRPVQGECAVYRSPTSVRAALAVEKMVTNAIKVSFTPRGVSVLSSKLDAPSQPLGATASENAASTMHEMTSALCSSLHLPLRNHL